MFIKINGIKIRLLRSRILLSYFFYNYVNGLKLVSNFGTMELEKNRSLLRSLKYERTINYKQVAPTELSEFFKRYDAGAS